MDAQQQINNQEQLIKDKEYLSEFLKETIRLIIVKIEEELD